MQLSPIVKFVLAVSALLSCAQATALRCFTSKALTAAPGEEYYYTGVTRILLQLPAKGSIGPTLTFIGPEGVSQTPVICTRREGKPFCSVEADGGGFYYTTFKKSQATITTTGIPGIFYQDNGKTHPAFANGPGTAIDLTETEAAECNEILSRSVQSTKAKAKAKNKTSASPVQNK